MEYVEHGGGRVKRPTTHPQREMEQAARRFVDAVEHVLDLSQVSRLVLDRTQIVAEFIDGSGGIVGMIGGRL
jgi:hypothetical protein